MKTYLKIVEVYFYLTIYRVFYFRRWAIAYGKIGNRLEIGRVNLGDKHKHRIFYPLKIVRL